MDDSDAVDAAVGSYGLDLHLGIALGTVSDCGSSDIEGRSGVPRNLFRAADRDDVADWCRGHEAERLVEEDAADPAMGRFCLFHLAGQLWTQNHSMAWH